MDKEVANRIRSQETMAECWRLWDSFYDRLAQLAQEDTVGLQKIHYTDYERLLKYYVLLFIVSISLQCTLCMGTKTNISLP